MRLYSWSRITEPFHNDRAIPKWQIGDFGIMGSVLTNPEGFKPIILNAPNL